MGSIHKTGKATVEIAQDMDDLFLGFLNTVAPNAKKIMDETFEKIEKEAKKDWPRRKPIVRTNEEGRVTFFKETSKESWSKFKRGARVDANGNIVVYLKNTAPYAWAIKFGVDSENRQRQDIIQPQGKKVADLLLVKPMKKESKHVIKALSEDLSRRL